MFQITRFQIPRPFVLQALPLAVLLLAVAAEAFSGSDDWWDGEARPFASIASVLLCIWMWLQWPRRKGSGIAFVIVATLILLPQLMFVIERHSSSGWANFTRHLWQYLAMPIAILAISSSTTLMLRLFFRWRLVDRELISPVAIKNTTSFSLFDLLILTTSSAIGMTMVRGYLRLDNNGYPFHEFFFLILTPFITTIAVFTLRFLAFDSWFRGAVAVLLLMPMISIAILAAVYMSEILQAIMQAAVSKSGETIAELLTHFIQSRASLDRLLQDFAAATIFAAIISLFGLLLRRCGIAFGLENVFLSNLSWSFLTKYARIAFALLVTATIAMQMVGKAGILDNQQEFVYFEQGWPWMVIASEQDANTSQSRITVYWSWLALAGDSTVFIFSIFCAGWLVPAWVKSSAVFLTTQTHQNRTARQILTTIYHYISMSLAVFAPIAVFGILVFDHPEWRGWSADSMASYSSFSQTSMVKERIFFELMNWRQLPLKGLVTISIDYNKKHSYLLANQNMLDAVCSTRWLRELSLYNCPLTPQHFESLVRRGVLNELSLSNCSLPPNVFTQISKLNSLQNLVVDDKVAADGDFLTHFKNLQSLTCSLKNGSQPIELPQSLKQFHCTLTSDRSESLFSNGRSLVYLMVDQKANAQEASIEDAELKIEVQSCPLLETIFILSPRLVTFTASDTPAVSSFLHHPISINDGEIVNSEETVSPITIGQRAGIRSIKIDSSNPDLSMTIGGVGLGKVVVPTSLEKLDLNFSYSEKHLGISPAIEQQLSLFPASKIHSLTIMGGNVNAQSASLIGSFANLESLNLFNTVIDKSDLANAVGNSIRELNATGVLLDQSILDRILNKVQSIERLDLGASEPLNINASGLKELQSLHIFGIKDHRSLRLHADAPLTQLVLEDEIIDEQLVAPAPKILAFGQCVDKELLQRFLRKDSKIIQIGSSQIEKQQWLGVDFMGCQDIQLFDERVGINELRSWRFSSATGNCEIRRLRLHAIDATPESIIEHIAINFPSVTELRLDDLSYSALPIMTDTYWMHNLYVDSPFERNYLIISLQGVEINKEVVMALALIRNLFAVDMRHCKIHDDAIDSFKFLNEGCFLCLKDAIFNPLKLVSVLENGGPVGIDLGPGEVPLPFRELENVMKWDITEFE